MQISSQCLEISSSSTFTIINPLLTQEWGFVGKSFSALVIQMASHAHALASHRRASSSRGIIQENGDLNTTCSYLCTVSWGCQYASNLWVRILSLSCRNFIWYCITQFLLYSNEWSYFHRHQKALLSCMASFGILLDKLPTQTCILSCLSEFFQVKSISSFNRTKRNLNGNKSYAWSY